MTPDAAMESTRRQALRQAGTGLGMLGLVGLLGDAGLLGQALAASHGRHGRHRREEPARAAGAAVPGQGQARHPHLPERRPVAGRHVRSQAAAQASTKGKMLPQGNLSTERKTGTALPSPFRFRKYGQSGIEVSEIFARTAAARRRHLRHPLDARQHAQPRTVDAADELRRRAAVAAEHGGLAHLRHGDRERRTCPASSPCAPACPSPTSPTGGPPSCPASTRARTSTPARRRPRT